MAQSPEQARLFEANSIGDPVAELPSLAEAQRSLARVVRNTLVLLALASPLSAEAQAAGTPSPQRALSFIHPDAPPAPGQDDYADFDDHLIPAPYPCDDVQKKDRKGGMDIPSPSPAFEAVKALQAGVKSRNGLSEERLKHLAKIRLNAEGHRLGSSSFPGSHPTWKELQDKADALMGIYQRETRLQGILSQQRGPIGTQLESLRKEIKTLVLLERKAGKAQKRCAEEQPDITDIAADFRWAFEMPTPPPDWVHSRQSYDGLVPFELTLEDYPCPVITDSHLANQEPSFSDLFERARFLETVLLEHRAAAAQRMESFLQMKQKGEGLPKGNPLKRRLLSVSKKGLALEAKIIQALEALLPKIAALKQAVLGAERTETAEAAAIGRCRMSPPPAGSAAPVPLSSPSIPADAGTPAETFDRTIPNLRSADGF